MDLETTEIADANISCFFSIKKKKCCFKELSKQQKLNFTTWSIIAFV